MTDAARGDFGRDKVSLVGVNSFPSTQQVGLLAADHKCAAQMSVLMLVHWSKPDESVGITT